MNPGEGQTFPFLDRHGCERKWLGVMRKQCRILHLEKKSYPLCNYVQVTRHCINKMWMTFRAIKRNETMNYLFKEQVLFEF